MAGLLLTTKNHHMKYLFILLFPCFLNAQIEVKKVVVLTDTTIQVQGVPDTTYWQFDKATKRFNLKDVNLFRAQLIKVQGGTKQVNLDSGVLPRREYREWLKTQLTWIEGDIENSRKKIAESQLLKLEVGLQLGR